MAKRATATQVKVVPLSDLVPDPANLRQHPEASSAAIAKSVGALGLGRSIVVDKDGVVRAGNGTLEAARAAGVSEAIVVETNGKQLVVVKRPDWTAEQALAYAIADNRTGELSAFDADALQAAVQSLAEHAVTVGDQSLLYATGFTEEQLALLLAEGILPPIAVAAHTRVASNGSGEAGVETDDAIVFSLFSREQVIDAAFEHYEKRGFPFPNLALHEQMQELNALAAVDLDDALYSTLGYRVADTYHPHRFAGKIAGKKIVLDSFDDPKQRRAAFALCLDQSKKITDASFLAMIALVRNTQACSNFRPALALHFYRRFGMKGGRTLDPCTGYGGRLIGWFASQLGGEYIGIDPNPPTGAANRRMADALFGSQAANVWLHGSPFEDAQLEPETFDFVFTSPPYFSKEHYADDASQSWVRYPTYEAWRTGFLQPLLTKSFAALKRDRFCVINIDDVMIGTKTYPLRDDTVAFGKAAGFELVDTELVRFGNPFGTNQDGKDSSEPFFVFRKP